MASHNKVYLIGRLTRDPEVRYTPKGSAVCDISLAINRAYTTESGEKKEEVTFVDVTLWAKIADVVAKYCAKGSSLFVEGRLEMDSWEDKQTGQKRTKLKVVGDHIQLLDSKPSGNAQGGQQSAPERKSEWQERSQRPARQQTQEAQLQADNDDIPY